MSRRYFFVVTLAVIATCAYLFASSVVQVAVPHLLKPPKARRTVTESLEGSNQLGQAKKKDMSLIASRNIFCSTCPGQGTEAAVSQNGTQGTPAPGIDPASQEAIRTTLELRLVATLVSEERGKWSYAAIHGDAATRFYGVAGLVPGGATVLEITNRRVYLQNPKSGRKEYLDLHDQDMRNRPTPQVLTPPAARLSALRDDGASPDWLQQGVRKTGEGKWEIQRNALNRVLANTTMLARSARIVPSSKNNQPNGFKLYAIRPGSLYSLIGMENADTIHAVNGREITTPDKALEVYTKVRSASHLTISFTRRGKQQTYDYTIR
jgi:general secretion pathway protein C